MNKLYSYVLICAMIIMSSCDSDNTSVTPAAGNIDLSLGTDTNCSSSHSNVGATGSFSTLDHGVSGTLTVIDDCTIQITGFNYDGGGPQVYFYAGSDGNYQNSNAFRFSKLLTGTSYSNDTITLVIPSTKSLDDFDSLSVWCVDFNANFGDIDFVP